MTPSAQLLAFNAYNEKARAIQDARYHASATDYVARRLASACLPPRIVGTVAQLLTRLKAA